MKADIIGRDDEFKRILFDESYPDYIIKNKKLFDEWIET